METVVSYTNDNEKMNTKCLKCSIQQTNKQTKKGTNKDVLKYTQYTLLLDLDQDLPKT